MPTRTTSAQVKEISASTTADNVVTAFIAVSSKIIDQALADGCDVSDSDQLEQAERFLTAHLLTTSGAGEAGGGKVITEKEFENYKVKYAMSQIKGDGIRLTNYGVTANILMNGCLSDVNSAKATVGFF